MTNNEIKKLVYKQKPTAVLKMIRGGNLYYHTLVVVSEINLLSSEFDVTDIVNFQVPISDIGTTAFFPTMEAKLLLRYLINEEN